MLSYSPARPKRCFEFCQSLGHLTKEGVAEFLTFGCTLGERTLFRGVHLLPGGLSLVL